MMWYIGEVKENKGPVFPPKCRNTIPSLPEQEYLTGPKSHVDIAAEIS